MQNYWDDARSLPRGSDGAPSFHLFLASKAQVERWHAVGYDICASIDRERAFLDRGMALTEQGDHLGADAAVTAYMRDEEAIAIASGIDATDPDFWRISRSFKHIGWDLDVVILPEPLATPDI
jgi:hypothetical protein